MTCRCPQLVFPVSGVPLEVDCGICVGCEVIRRLEKKKRYIEHCERIRCNWRRLYEAS